MLAAILAGGLIELAAMVQQLAWHASQGEVEPVQSVLLAHAGIYLGALLGTWGAWRLARASATPAPLLLLLGGGLRCGAALLDAGIHALGGDPLPGHLLYKVGIAIALAGGLVALPLARPVNVVAR